MCRTATAELQQFGRESMTPEQRLRSDTEEHLNTIRDCLDTLWIMRDGLRHGELFDPERTANAVQFVLYPMLDAHRELHRRLCEID